MNGTTRSIVRLVAALLTFAALASPARAGGPLANCQAGVPYRWPSGGTNIPYNPDQGGLGPLTNAQATALVGTAFGQWGALPTASTTYLDAGPLPVDVDITNFGPYLSPTAPDGLSAIVFDDTGEIFDFLFGPGSGVLGFAGPEWLDPTTCTIQEGVSFLNGPSFDDLTVALDVMVHEFGHYQNLAHTVVNGQIVLGDNSGPTPNDTFPIVSLVGKVETMYPFYFGPAAGMSTPHADDIAMLSFLYPSPGYAATRATISGKILGPNGTARITGVNVIARNVASPYDDAVSAISSDFATDLSVGAPLVGTYAIRGLTPGASYAVFVDEIFAGGFSTPPKTPLPGPEELYNGSSESADASTDDPAVFTPVSAGAGQTAADTNIIFNAPPPGPLDIGDDGTMELFPAFPIRFCGQDFDSLWVNANGSLSFGDGSASFSESIQGHLGGPPRIAGLWDDLNPAAGGTVAFEASRRAFTVTWTDVPEYPAAGANTFSITLSRRDHDDDDHDDHHGHHDGDDDHHGGSGNEFTVRYGALGATDGLAGYSCGGRITSGFEKETSLRTSPAQSRRTIETRGKTAVFEIFTAADNDLDDFKLEYEGTSGFDDDLEPNDTLARATRVRLPYNSGPETFTEIRPLGHDVDFYRFSAKAGEILVAETVPGNQVDTVIGVFDGAGTLLAADDDSGAFGLGGLSRLAIIVPATGTYYIGVTTFPDFGFTGAGQDFGRYVVTINTYNGTILPLFDDDAVSLPLAFSFPFQGQNRTSVFVNGNGNLTFGAADPDFSETVPELLAGPPRIAPLWDDLFPGDGLVIAEEKHDSLTIHFATVPEFFDLRPNYFSVELKKGGAIRMDWQATSRGDAIVGITQGGGAADPGPTNLSRFDTLSPVGTTYQQFVGFFSDFDLFFDDVAFGMGRHGGHDHD